MKIDRTSNTVKFLEESARNHNIVLQWKINKIASWMSFKSSEINDYSWIISAVLKSPFCSSCSWQAYFPSIVRPINLWKLISKKIFDPPGMNRSILFSMYLLRMLKKMNYFLENFVSRERMFPWFYINQIPSFHVNDSRWRVSKFSFFCLAFAFDRHAISFASNCNACSSSWSSGTSVSLLVESITNLFDPWEILTQEWVLSSVRDQFLISTPY